MKVIIVGLGRMGYTLTKRLSKEGNQVTVIDLEEEVFEKLEDNISYEKIVGVGFDKDILEKAKIERADAIVACTSSDEVNVLIARIAKNIYNVPKVIARTYDSRKGEIYDRLGIETVSTNAWAAERVVELINYDKFDLVYEIGETQLIRVEVPMLLAGRNIREITVLNEIIVVSIERNNKTFIPVSGTVLEEGDIVYFSILNTSFDLLKQILGLK